MVKSKDFCLSQSHSGDVSEEAAGSRGAAGQREEEQVHDSLISDPSKCPETEHRNVLYTGEIFIVLGCFQGRVRGRERRPQCEDRNSERAT